VRLALPAATVFTAALSCCCCGDLFSTIGELIGDLDLDSLPMEGLSMDGLSAGGSGPLSDVPEFPGADLEAEATVGGTSTRTYQVSEGTPKEIVAFHVDHCNDSGWTVGTHVDTDDSSVLQCTNDGQTLSVTASDQGEQIWLVVSLEGA